ncbi:gamma-aminobutyric acid receptor subunit alpha-2-like isoform X2 [Paramacrobiotus metropolitanus]|uniref:gamma-aminobutyric acid receptor subunit alpha-2-like isoform X2 n=1 Tax=Paramacrobiotus metropolitanus TaxID=2943436 RepID=UPI0024457CD9|nr:gamma-aminobutyric acid receptor subunit alpha-2-like isoform X2 [Paramacrobiotus metropolitanus]
MFHDVLVGTQIILDPLVPDSKPVRRTYIYSIISGTNRSLERHQRLRRAPEESQNDIYSSKVTTLLNSLFDRYNKTFRPNYGHGPTQVRINMVVISMGPISELNSDYSMDIYFRQKWRDERLKFNGSEDMKELALNNLMLDNIWKPDTYFRNGKEYYVHTITTANKLLRLQTTGDILYSMRLRIRAQCQMRLSFYPADIQSCPLIIGSFAYQAHEVLYYWDPDHRVKTEAGLTLSQYELKGPPPCENFFAQFDSGMKKENYSMARVDFILQRRMGYFLLQIYLPCMLIVVLSWVSFWLNREATERLSLGITALLTLATMNQDQKDVLPKTSYPTALEWYILICNLYVSASIIQFAAVHFFTKTGFEELNFPKDREAVTGGEDDWEEIPEVELAEMLGNLSSPKLYATIENQSNHIGASKHHSVVKINQTVITTSEEQLDRPFGNETFCQKLFYCITGNENYRSELIRRGKYRTSSINSVSLLDRASRIGFPLTFGLVNLVYWISFLYSETPPRTSVGNPRAYLVWF